MGENRQKNMTELQMALFGLHGDPAISKALVRVVSSQFKVEKVADVEQMLARCRQTHYGFYVMVLNFGQEAALNISPAQAVYQLLREQKIQGLERKFIGVSSSVEVVELAQQCSIPAILKPVFGEYFSGLFPR